MKAVAMKCKVANTLHPLPPTLCERQVWPLRGFAFMRSFDLKSDCLYTETSHTFDLCYPDPPLLASGLKSQDTAAAAAVPSGRLRVSLAALILWSSELRVEEGEAEYGTVVKVGGSGWIADPFLLNILNVRS